MQGPSWNRKQWQVWRWGTWPGLACPSVQPEQPSPPPQALLVARAGEALNQMGEGNCGFLHSQPNNQSSE